MKKYLNLNLIWISLVLLLLAGCSGGELSIEGAWARPGIPGGNSAVYFTIDNPTGQADTLLSAECSMAQHAELHRSKMTEEGAMTMEPQESVPVPAGEQVSFEPGGLHVMLVSMNEEIQPGDSLPLTLRFEKAGEMQITAEVRQP